MKNVLRNIGVLFLVVFQLSQNNVLASTSQEQDRLIYEGDTIFIFQTLLDTYLEDNDKSIFDLFSTKELFVNTTCWSGYYAYWYLFEDRLYLSEIRSCEGNLKVDLKRQFEELYKQNIGVEANWVKETLVGSNDEMNLEIDIYSNFITYYKEVNFKIDKGHLIKVYEHDNLSSYITLSELESVGFDELVDWYNLPDSSDSTIIEIELNFQTDGEGKVQFFERRVDKGKEVYLKEAKRVIESIKEYFIFYFEGEIVQASWIVPFQFNYQNKY